MRRRQLLIASVAIPVLPLFAGSRSTMAKADAVVSLKQAKAQGIPSFGTIGAALAAAPVASRIPFRIHIDTGVWTEKLVIDKPNIHLVGTGQENCSIRFDASAGQLDPQGALWGTWRCASVRVTAPGFAATDLAIINGFDYLGHLRNPKLESIGSNGAQAVALMLDQGSDRAVLERCDINGHQDTLFVDAGRSVFRECGISGSVDFIFGAGQSLFQQCELLSRYRPGKPRQGYVAAPSTSVSKPFGLVFRRCNLLSEDEVPPGSVALGRAWRPTREFDDGRYGDPDALGAAAYIECQMGNHIAVEGWDSMKYTARDGTRVELHPAQARLAEYASSGPGAQTNPDRPQLSAEQARSYANGGWLADLSSQANPGSS